MPEVRKENGTDLEYVCPECGDTFEEGAEECASCGMAFDWSEEMEYLCPECGTVVDPDQARCPGCSAKFSTDEHGDVIIEYEPEQEPPSVEELLETAIDEVRIRPNGSVEVVRSSGEQEAAADAPEERTTEGPAPRPSAPRKARARAGAKAGGTVPEGHKGGGPRTSKAARRAPTANLPRLYPGGFTRVGMMFLTLAVLSFMFTVVMARYDTWIQGAAEESMGDNQRMLFLGGLLTFTVSIIVAIYDLLRTPRGIDEVPA